LQSKIGRVWKRIEGAFREDNIIPFLFELILEEKKIFDFVFPRIILETLIIISNSFGEIFCASWCHFCFS